MSKRIYQNSREKILETAKTILVEEGVGKLSTDNLILKSGLSKGGFFYHFKTKNDLINALSFKILQDMADAIQKLTEKDPKKKGATLRAYINFTLSKQNDEITAVCRSMLEVVFDKNNHDMEMYKKFGQDLIKKSIAEGISRENVMHVFLVLDGYWYNDVFGNELFPKKEVRKYIKSLSKLTE